MGKQRSVVEEEGQALVEDVVQMPVFAINYWLSRFVLEVKRQDGTDYPPNPLYQICCGLMRNMKFHDRADINFFSDPVCESFRGILDSKMKELQTTGEYISRKANVITLEGRSGTSLPMSSPLSIEIS